MIETHQAVAAAGLPLLWINPEAELVGWGWTQRQPIRAPYDLGRMLFRDGYDEKVFAVPVNVYRLVSADTIEDKVVALQERKRELFATVGDEGALATGAVSPDDIRALLD